MTLTNETNNIIKGRVEATPEYPGKIIGVSTLNITPGEDGVAPLSKKTAFMKEEPVPQFVNPVDIMNPVTLEQSSTPMQTLNDVSPVSVTDPSSLDKVDTPDTVIPIFEAIKAPEVPEETVSPLDIQLPDMMPVTEAQEPSIENINNKLFVNPTELTGNLLDAGNTNSSNMNVDTPVQETVVPENVAPTSSELVENIFDINNINIPNSTIDTPVQETNITENVTPVPSELSGNVFINTPSMAMSTPISEVDVIKNDKKQALIEDITKYVKERVEAYLNEVVKEKEEQQDLPALSTVTPISFAAPEEESSMSLAA